MKFYDALTDFIFTEQKPEKADAIFVPGGLYGEIAQHAAELYQQGFASLVVPSGKYSIVEGKFTKVQSPEKYKGRYFETESDFLTQILVDEGVKKSDILQEKEASYTYQNALFTKDLLDKKGLHLKKVILSCQAYHARRCLMYYQFVFPEIEFIVSPVITSFKRKLVSERVRYLSGTQRGGTLRQPVRRYDVATVPLSDKCR